MNLLNLMLALLLVAAPFQAHACDAASPEVAAVHAGMSEHADHGAGSGDHGCCADPGTPQDTGCDDSSGCEHCLAGASAVPTHPEALNLAPTGYRSRLAPGDLPPSHSTPPFRPPASAS